MQPASAGLSRPAGRPRWRLVAVASLHLFLVMNLNLLPASGSLQQTSPVPSSTTESARLIDLDKAANLSSGPAADFLVNLVKSNLNNQSGAASGASAAGPTAPGRPAGANATSSALTARFTPQLPFKPRLGQHEHFHFKTTYGCEGNQLDLACSDSKLIHLVRANFGRFSLSICNDEGHSNYSVGCYSVRAFLIMQARCNKLTNCSVIVSKELFGDPCEGTSKYLEVQYYCDGEGAGSTSSSSSSSSSPAQPANKTQSGTMLSAPPLAARQPAAHQKHHQAPTTSAVITAPMCPPQASARGLLWNSTRAGQWARQPCPDGAAGVASWFCDADRLRFAPGHLLDLSQCRTSWLERLAAQLDQLREPAGRLLEAERRLQHEQALRALTNDLLLVVRTKELFSEDLRRLDSLLGQLVAQLRAHRTQLHWDALSRLAALVSSLFELNQRWAWLELASDELRHQLEMRLLGHLRDCAALAAGAAGRPEPVRTANVLVAVLELRQLVAGETAGQPQVSADELQASELQLEPPLVKELIGEGVSRLVVLDVKKPDYWWMRQHSDLDELDNSNLAAAHQAEASSRLLGLFAVLDDTNGQLLNDQSRLANLLAQWPVGVRFRLSGGGWNRQCSSLEQSPTETNKCHTLSANATNHLCSCDTLGFVHLSSAASLGQPAAPPANNNILADFGWSPTSPRAPGYQLSASAPLDSASFGQSPAPKQPQPRSSLWSSLLVLLSLVLLVAGLAVLVVGALLRAAARPRLSKKQHGFLATPPSSPVFASAAHQHLHQAHLAALAGTTTGPLAGAEHSLIGDHQHRTGGALLAVPANHSAASTTTTYKPGQQLYAAGLVAGLEPSPENKLSLVDTLVVSGRRVRHIVERLNPLRLFGFGSASRAGQRLGAVQHRLVVSSTRPEQVQANNTMSAYRNQQNGYTTSLHHGQHQRPQLANSVGQQHSSSTSSYVSSSAYYEEIAPRGSQTKLHPSQLAQRTVLIDPFKQHRSAAWSPSTAATSSTGLTGGTYSLEQNYSTAGVQVAASTTSLANMLGQKLQPELTSGQPTANGPMTTAGRHYLFASPSAVSAYKSSIVDQQQQQQQQQQHFQQQQQQHQQQQFYQSKQFGEQARFM